MASPKDCGSGKSNVLRQGWFEASSDHVRIEAAGIYEWQIEGVGVYVGKSKNLKSRIREYSNNVRKKIEGKPYRKGKPDKFRPVHQALVEAHQRMLMVRYVVLGTYEPETLNRHEQTWIKKRRAEEAQGGLRVLNGEPSRTRQRGATR